jgi:5-methyltetrahydrofolate--homocysteine methyltransferase
VHVLDASRVVGVVSSLLDPVRREQLTHENVELQDRLREQHAEKERRPLVPIETARANAEHLSFDELPVPAFTGTRLIEPDLATLREYIDWQFFFHAWDLKGKFPAILEQPAARELYDDAIEILDRIVSEEALRARGVYGFWPATSGGDDIVVENDNGAVVFNFLRQQAQTQDSRPSRCLADYVAAANDHVGAFAVTAGLGADELAAQFEAEHDDYRAIIVKALADRFAEAFAEYLHEVARREWYETGPKLTNEQLMEERYRGIRPAFGYPACPDHSEKGKLVELLGADRIGLELTETFAMVPAASVSGIYLGHPKARYFAVGRVGRDQVEDYARRKGQPIGEVEQWLRPNLAYDA